MSPQTLGPKSRSHFQRTLIDITMAPVWSKLIKVLMYKQHLTWTETHSDLKQAKSKKNKFANYLLMFFLTFFSIA